MSGEDLGTRAPPVPLACAWASWQDSSQLHHSCATFSVSASGASHLPPILSSLQAERRHTELSAGPSAASCATALFDEDFSMPFEEDDERVTELSNREGVGARQPELSSFRGKRQPVRRLLSVPRSAPSTPRWLCRAGSQRLSVRDCQRVNEPRAGGARLLTVIYGGGCYSRLQFGKRLPRRTSRQDLSLILHREG